MAGCELFVNGIEWFGRRLALGEGAVGSVLAAVGTALPETLIPFIAILIKGGAAGEGVGTGAILGAPFMLSSLALFVCGLAVLVYASSGRRSRTIKINRAVLQRDLSFFLVIYTVAVILGLIDVGPNKRYLALLFVLAYGVYVFFTMRSEGDLDGDVRSLYFHRTAHSPGLRRIVLQVFVALAAIVFGAELFVDHITKIALALHMPPLAISLLLTPLATELPEKFNSISWMRDRKDALALGNITGAMVFQSAFPVAIGIGFTAWKLEGEGLFAALLALGSGALLLARVRLTGSMSWPSLLVGGVFYLTFVTVTLVHIL
ncbi:MAG: sodium:calcium antiporter [Actinobacteria bacterium]|nr:sodium:calcium antiporter [Actinomycetota bacterium]